MRSTTADALMSSTDTTGTPRGSARGFRSTKPATDAALVAGIVKTQATSAPLFNRDNNAGAAS